MKKDKSKNLTSEGVRGKIDVSNSMTEIHSATEAPSFSRRSFLKGLGVLGAAYFVNKVEEVYAASDLCTDVNILNTPLSNRKKMMDQNCDDTTGPFTEQDCHPYGKGRKTIARQCGSGEIDGISFTTSHEIRFESGETLYQYEKNGKVVRWVRHGRDGKIVASSQPSTQSAQMKPASGFGSAKKSSGGESDAARETRLLREQLARAEEERIRRERDRRIDDAMQKRYGWK